MKELNVEWILKKELLGIVFLLSKHIVDYQKALILTRINSIKS